MAPTDCAAVSFDETDSRRNEMHIDALAGDHGLKSYSPTNTERDDEWAVETTNASRTDKGLHTTFFLQTDGKGTPLSNENYEQMR